MARKLNLAKLKNKVAELNKKGGGGGQRKSVFWTPSLPKGETSATYEIFIIPWPDLEDYPFKERWFYYNLGNMKDEEGNSLKDENGRFIKAPLTLKQFNEPDPVDDLIRQLWNRDGKEKAEADQDREDAKALFASQTIYVPVIVRGEEELGVRLWKFSSKNVYERLIELFMEDGVGVLNDPENDIWLKIKVVEEPGKKFPMNKKVNPPDLVLLNRKPLSNDKVQIKEWLASVPDLDEALKYQRYDSEGLKKLLLMWTETGAASVNLDDGTEAAKAEDPDMEETEKKITKQRGRKKQTEDVDKSEAIDRLKNKFGDDDDDDDDE